METILLLSQTETSSHDADTLHLLFMCVHLYNNAYVQQSMFKNVQKLAIPHFNSFDRLLTAAFYDFVLLQFVSLSTKMQPC